MFPTQSCDIKRKKDGYTDEDGKWVPAEEKLVAKGEFDIQPMGGNERSTALQTDYESSHKAFADKEDITFEDGFSIIKKGDILIDTGGKEYTIVFPADWGHYELDLKEA